MQLKPQEITRIERDAFESVQSSPLLSALFSRRTRRISRGLSFDSGTLSFKSKHDPQPLSPLEEALLIASTGVTGLTMPDLPYRTPSGKLMHGRSMPSLGFTGLSSASPDSAHVTRFFVWNDTGTYFLRHPDELPPPDVAEMGPDELVSHVEGLKVKVLDERLEFPREFPAYFGRNAAASNLPGTTLFVPVVEIARQYINGLLHLLSEEDGKRPVIRDDFNFYRPCGCEKWVRSGFLNRDLPIPLSLYGKGRIDYEAVLLLQNLALTASAMGLGGWIHSTFPPIILFGGTDLGKGLGFRFEEPVFVDRPSRARSTASRLARPALKLRRKLRPFPSWLPNPVGLDGLMEAYCPPYYKNMEAAVEAVVAEKVSDKGYYKDPRFLGHVYKPELVSKVIDELPGYRDETIKCVKAICTYIYETYGRFPAHCNAIEAPGICLQAHHVDLDYYETFFQTGYSEAELNHQRVWHGAD